MRSNKYLAGLLLTGLILINIPVSSLAKEKTSTGFYWPIGENNFDSGVGWWLSKPPNYFSNYYHIGVDIMSQEDHPVYAISSGIVVARSENGWTKGGSKNIALLIKHYFMGEDGEKKAFVVLYGHIKASSTNLRKDNTVYPGELIGKVGYWSDGNHLHFGIHPGSSIPNSDVSQGVGWGRMTINHWPDTNGFVDPINFLETHAPYLNLSDDSCPVEFNVKAVDNYAWYPPNVDCFDAVYWFEILSDRCVQRSRDICFELQGTCPANVNY